MINQFTCAVCQGTFNKGWTDEEARQERSEIFGEWKDEDCVIICNDCFVKRLSYEELLVKARKDMADYYKAERKSNPEIARMIWKMQAEMQKQLTDAIMYGTGYRMFNEDGSIKHVGLVGLINDPS